MDPTLDQPPLAAQPAVVIPPASAPPAAQNHPPYAEMISAAITALNEKEGSSKRAIAKYIETQYSGLPPTHSALLTHHLKRLKADGQLVMVKYSYKLPGPRSAPLNGVEPDPAAAAASSAVKKRPGRPPKSNPDSLQAAVPVFPPPLNMNDVPAFPQPAGNVAVLPENSHIAAGNGAAAATPVRGRGRPPKLSGVKRGPGRPPRSGGGGGVGGRSRGRPRKAATPVSAPTTSEKRPRGRPPKPINVVVEANVGGGDVAAAPVGVGVGAAAPVVAPKRRGRPPKAGNEAKRPRNVAPKPPRKLSGKPLGRPRKNAQVMGNRTQDSQLLVAYLDLKAKLENLQSKVKQTASFVRPFLNSEGAIHAIQELELAAANSAAAPNVQAQQQQAVPVQLQS